MRRAFCGQNGQVRLSLRSKLILFTVLPVVAVYLFLFGLGISHVSTHFGRGAKDLLVEHARHQASRLALLLSQAPALAEALGEADLAVGELDQDPETVELLHLRSVGSGLDLVGWTVVVPTLLVLAFGLYLDDRIDTSISFAITFLVVGAATGVSMAWYWITSGQWRRRCSFWA